MSAPLSLFDTSVLLGINADQQYDVGPDGERFLFNWLEGAGERELHVVLNWFEDLKQKVPLD